MRQMDLLCTTCPLLHFRPLLTSDKIIATVMCSPRISFEGVVILGSRLCEDHCLPRGTVVKWAGGMTEKGKDHRPSGGIGGSGEGGVRRRRQRGATGELQTSDVERRQTLS